MNEDQFRLVCAVCLFFLTLTACAFIFHKHPDDAGAVVEQKRIADYMAIAIGRQNADLSQPE